MAAYCHQRQMVDGFKLSQPVIIDYRVFEKTDGHLLVVIGR